MSKNLATMKLSRRMALALVASGLGSVVLAACAPTAPSAGPTISGTGGGGATPGAAAGGGTPQPKSGGTLRFGSDVDVNRLDPHFRLGDVYYGVYDRLTQYDISHTPQPMLAESWDIASDFTSIKFNLRKGVTFHNGADLDSAAVKFNSERARDLPNTQLDEAKWWTSIETPDKYTVIFKSDKPRPLAFDYFEFLNIAEPTSANDPTRAVGTGPFKFVEWRQNDALTLVKNPNTAEPDPAKRKQLYSDLNDMLLDEVYIIVMSPTTNRLIATSKVQGISPTLHSAQKWWEAWLAA